LKTNPFKTLVGELSTETWKLVSLEYLNHVADLVNQEEQRIFSFGEAFAVLEYLEQAKIVELRPVEDTGIYKIRKGY
jgi:hypothetical protein